MRGLEIALVAVAFWLAACASPEATRTRGGGPGADLGNRTQIVEMHEGSKPFEGTPQIITVKHPSLEPLGKPMNSVADKRCMAWGS